MHQFVSVSLSGDYYHCTFSSYYSTVTLVPQVTALRVEFFILLRLKEPLKIQFFCLLCKNSNQYFRIDDGEDDFKGFFDGQSDARGFETSHFRGK